MLRIKNIKQLNDYLSEQYIRYPHPEDIKAVIINDLTGYEYYILGEDEYSNYIYHIAVSTRIRGQRLNKILSTPIDAFIGKNFYIDKSNSNIGMNYKDKLERTFIRAQIIIN